MYANWNYFYGWIKNFPSEKAGITVFYLAG
jgi:hypothetical protein